MDGLGFIATLHAAALDQQCSTSLLLKPATNKKLRPSRGSISGKAKSLVNRSRSFFCVSSSSTPVVRTSTSSSQSIADHGHSHKRYSSTSENCILSIPSTSSRVASEDHPHCPNAPRSSTCSEIRRPQDPLTQLTTLHITSNHTCCNCIASPFGSLLKPTWFSRLVDNGYISPSQSSSPTSVRSETDAEPGSYIEPSRASSMLDRDFLFISHDDRPNSSQRFLPPMPSLSLAEPFRFSLDDV